MAYLPPGGLVPVHPWFFILRSLQALFSVPVIAATAYSLSIEGGGPIKAALAPTIVIALLTLALFIPLTTPLHFSQHRLYDPRIALALDLVATLFWLASFAALASYLDVFHDYERGLILGDSAFAVCERCMESWRSGVAAAVFAALEFLLFLFTTLAFTYYYHCHLASESAYGVHEKQPEHTAHGTTYALPYSSTAPTASSVATEHHLRSPTEDQTQMHSPLDLHAPTNSNHMAGHVPYPHVSDLSAFRTSHPPTPHPQTGGYSGAFRTSHPLISAYEAPLAADAGASPISEEREGAVSPPLPPKSPSRLERRSGVFEGQDYSGAGAGANSTRL